MNRNLLFYLLNLFISTLYLNNCICYEENTEFFKFYDINSKLEFKNIKSDFLFKIRFLLDNFFYGNDCLISDGKPYNCIFLKLSGAKNLLCRSCYLKCKTECLYTKIVSTINDYSKPSEWLESKPAQPCFNELNNKINILLNDFSNTIGNCFLFEYDLFIYNIKLLTENYISCLYKFYFYNQDIYYYCYV
jgi:hypothetical protein